MVDYDFTFKIVLIGDESEGKSYFARSFCYNLFNSYTGMTIGVDFLIKNLIRQEKNIKFQIWDIGAEERFRFLYPIYCRGASGGIIIYDVENANSLARILENVQIIRSEAGDVPIMIIGTQFVEDDDDGFLKIENPHIMNSEEIQIGNKLFEDLAETILKKTSRDIIVVPKPLELKRIPGLFKWPEFKVNEYLELRLEYRRTNIYVGGKLFNNCKYLLLNLERDDLRKYDNIESIDEAAELLGDSMHGVTFQEYHISSEAEFWGHCSNLHAWYENEYDTRILHRNLAFPLLDALVKAGDPLAKRVFKEEVALRLESGYPSVVMYLIKEKYLECLSQEELNTIFENPTFHENLSNWFKDTNVVPKWLASKIKVKLKALNLWK